MTAQTAPSALKAQLGRMGRAREFSTVFALVLLAIIGSLVADGFLGPENLLTVGQQVSQIGIMAVGATFVIINGEIDLSVGSTYALGAISAGLLLAAGAPWVLAVVAGMLIGAVAGLINGLLVVGLGIPSFIVTLGTLSVFRGTALLMSGGSPISLTQSMPGVAEFSLIGQGRLFGLIPMQLVIFTLIAVIFGILLHRSRFGFSTYAVGGSAEAARLCGIKSQATKALAFVIQGTLAGLAGVIGLSFLSYVQGVTGTGMELTVISAVIIGGAALSGGAGSMLGTIIGVVFIGVLQNILNLTGVSSFWQTIATGAVIIIAVAADILMRKRTFKQ